MKHINKIGVELEGGWDKTFTDCVIGSDSSVSVEARHVGELASPPMDPKEALPWVEAHYPPEGNSTCGMHVHISLKTSLDYTRLMRNSFWQKFQEDMKEFADAEGLPSSHPFIHRLSGGNTYCAKKFIPLQQVKDTNKGGERYSQLNYCWNLHGTLECRLLPWFEDPKQAIRAIEALLRCVENFLSKAPKEKNILTKFYAGPSGVEMESRGKQPD